EYIFHTRNAYVQKLPFTIGTLASYGDSLILTNDDLGGFHYYNFNLDTLYNRIPYLFQQNISEIIPLNLTKTKGTDLLILTEEDSRNSLYLTDSDGNPWPGFPVSCLYNTLRVYFKGDELRIVAVTTDGRTDILNERGKILESFHISPIPKTLFITKIDDAIQLISEGDLITLEGDSVHWGYAAGDLFGSRYIRTDDTFFTEYPVAFLIANNLIYNYPNPVSVESTRFRYFAVSAEKIDIAIYDLKGKFVEQLSQIPIQNQWNEIVWNVRNYDSGVYIAKVTISGLGKSETFIIKPAILK
ncbi:MAG TPA: T9SS type A sorting domain-containing protein, partial [Candidatus Marinimicrobia bacterium]|nr:T9SS type A sorting domain-containing protein [Candidatus Neomarinimicrobiota bacterium]